MKINHKKTLAAGLSFMMFLPLLAFAFQIVPPECTSGDPNLCNFCAFMKMINGAINWFIGLAGIVAAITFAIAGGKMLLNPENAAKRTEAIEMFKKTGMGLVIVLGAWLVVHTIVAALVNPNINALRFLGGTSGTVNTCQ